MSTKKKEGITGMLAIDAVIFAFLSTQLESVDEAVDKTGLLIIDQLEKIRDIIERQDERIDELAAEIARLKE